MRVRLMCQSQSSFYPGVLSDKPKDKRKKPTVEMSQSSFYPGVLSDFPLGIHWLEYGHLVSIQFLSWGSF